MNSKWKRSYTDFKTSDNPCAVLVLTDTWYLAYELTYDLALELLIPLILQVFMPLTGISELLGFVLYFLYYLTMDSFVDMANYAVFNQCYGP